MKEELEKLAHTKLENPFDQELEFEQWNQFDIARADFQNAIQVMRNLVCECSFKPKPTKEQLDNMIQKIREAN